MEYDEMFTVLSMCFAPVGQDEWKQLIDGPLWSDFLDAARRGLQDDDALGEPTSPIARVRSRCPLQEFLSAGEVKALFTPPTYDEKRLFAARHFTGGLPESAVPAESLYTTWSNGSLPSPFSKAEGMYQGDSARYMRDLVERMGMRVPPEFSACPDHLALELDLAAVLLRSGMRARFYIGLVDVLVGMREHLALTSGAGEQGIDADARAERNRLHACI